MTPARPTRGAPEQARLDTNGLAEIRPAQVHLAEVHLTEVHLAEVHLTDARPAKPWNHGIDLTTSIGGAQYLVVHTWKSIADSLVSILRLHRARVIHLIVV
jgi:hypothetical protein